MTYPPQDPNRQPYQPHPQQPGMYPPPGYPATPPPKKKSMGTGKVLLIIGAGFVGLCCIGSLIVGAVSSTSPSSRLPDQSRNNSHPYDPPVPTDTGAVSIPAAAPTTQAAPPPPPPKPTIAEGTWTVGTDFPAGTYRTVGAGTTCYWKITKSGSNESDIVNNHIGGGNLTVTLSSGQDFTTNRCGKWTKAD